MVYSQVNGLYVVKSYLSVFKSKISMNVTDQIIYSYFIGIFVNKLLTVLLLTIQIIHPYCLMIKSTYLYHCGLR